MQMKANFKEVCTGTQYHIIPYVNAGCYHAITITTISKISLNSRKTREVWAQDYLNFFVKTTSLYGKLLYTNAA